jgi:hypothetical protein
MTYAELPSFMGSLLDDPDALAKMEAAIQAGASRLEMVEWCYERIPCGYPDDPPRDERVYRLLGFARDDLGPPAHDYRCLSSNCPGCG